MHTVCSPVRAREARDGFRMSGPGDLPGASTQDPVAPRGRHEATRTPHPLRVFHDGGADGHAVAPPAGPGLIHAKDVPLAPQWFLDLCEEAEARHPDADTLAPGVAVDAPANVDRARRFLCETVPAVEGRGGNNHTYATAEVLRSRFALSEDRAGKLMLEAFNPRCAPQWEPDELLGIVANAYRYARRPVGHDAPREDPFEGLTGTAAPEAKGPQPANEDGDDPARAQRIAEWRRRLGGVSERDFDNIPRPSYRVHRILPKRGKVLIQAPKSAFKTGVAVDLVMSILTGTTWAAGDGLEGFAVKQAAGAVYVAAEGHPGVAARIRAWRLDRGLPLDGSAPDAFLLRTAINVKDPDQKAAFFAELDAECHRSGGLQTVVLDTLHKFMAASGLDENSALDVGVFVQFVEGIEERYGCTVIVLHHLGKDARKGSRGSSALPAAFDTVIELRAHKNPRRVDFEVLNQKDDAELEYKLQFAPGTSYDVGANEDGERVQSFALRRCSRLAPVKDVVDDERARLAIKVMRAAPGHSYGHRSLAQDVVAHMDAADSVPDQEAHDKQIESVRKALARAAKAIREGASHPLAEPLRPYHAAEERGGRTETFWVYRPEAFDDGECDTEEES